MKYIENRQHYESLREADRLQQQMEREINAMKASGCEVGCRRPQVPIYGNSPRRRGSINFNIGFGKGRNRGNINIGKGW